MMRLVPVLVAAAAVSLAWPTTGLAQSDSTPAAPAEAKKKAAPKKTTKKPESKPASEGAGTGAPGGATLVATFGDWGAYTAQNGRSKLCYALSEPKARSPGNLKGTKAYLFVSFRPADNVRNELASVLNFPTKEDGPAALAIGTASYELVTRGQNAWIAKQADEAAAIAAMGKGGAVTVQATSAKGNKTSDRYSLTGFGQALDRAKRDCP